MANEASFDVVSKVNLQEVDNAVNQAVKEIGQRYDFRNSLAEIILNGEELKISADNDYKLKSIIDILQTKLIKRGVSIKNLEYAKVEAAAGGTVRQIIRIKQGIGAETAKQMVKDIKAFNLKVQTQIMSDQLRVSGKSRDDLQTVIQALKGKDYGVELQFTNYR